MEHLCAAATEFLLHRPSVKLDDVQHSRDGVPFVFFLGEQGVGEDLRNEICVPDKV